MSFRPIKPRPHGTTAEIISRAYQQVGGEKQVEVILSPVKKSQIYAYAETDDSERKQRLSFDQSRHLVRAGALAFAEALAADAGGFLVPAPSSDETINELLARGETAHGRMMAAHLRNLDRDGMANASPDMLCKLDEYVSDLAAVIAAVRKRLAA